MNLSSWCRVVLSVGAMVACGDDSGGGGSPAEKCRVLAAAACQQLVTCDLLSRSVLESCIDQVVAEADCDDIKAVPDTYDECLEELKSDECPDQAGDFPAACDFPDDEEDPAEKCRELAEAACEQLVACDAAESTELDACIEQVATAADCADAETVPANFDDCLDELQSDQCPSQAGQLPAACEF